MKCWACLAMVIKRLGIYVLSMVLLQNVVRLHPPFLHLFLA